MEWSLSVAMMDECRSNQKTGDGIDVKERKGKEEKLNEDVGRERDKMTETDEPRFTLKLRRSLCTKAYFYTSDESAPFILPRMLG